MTTIQFLKTDTDIYNRINILTNEKFSLLDDGSGSGILALFELKLFIAYSIWIKEFLFD